MNHYDNFNELPVLDAFYGDPDPKFKILYRIYFNGDRKCLIVPSERSTMAYHREFCDAVLEKYGRGILGQVIIKDENGFEIDTNAFYHIGLRSTLRVEIREEIEEALVDLPEPSNDMPFIDESQLKISKLYKIELSGVRRVISVNSSKFATTYDEFRFRVMQLRLDDAVNIEVRDEDGFLIDEQYFDYFDNEKVVFHVTWIYNRN